MLEVSELMDTDAGAKEGEGRKHLARAAKSEKPEISSDVEEGSESSESEAEEVEGSESDDSWAEHEEVS